MLNHLCVSLVNTRHIGLLASAGPATDITVCINIQLQENVQCTVLRSRNYLFSAQAPLFPLISAQAPAPASAPALCCHFKNEGNFFDNLKTEL